MACRRIHAIMPSDYSVLMLHWTRCPQNPSKRQHQTICRRMNTCNDDKQHYLLQTASGKRPKNEITTSGYITAGMVPRGQGTQCNLALLTPLSIMHNLPTNCHVSLHALAVVFVCAVSSSEACGQEIQTDTHLKCILNKEEK